MGSESAPEKPWDQQPDEPTLWFKRFSRLLADGANTDGRGGILRRVCQAPPRQDVQEDVRHQLAGDLVPLALGQHAPRRGTKSSSRWPAWRSATSWWRCSCSGWI